MNFFKVKSVTDIRKAEVGSTIPESDFSLYTGDDKFVQFELVREEEKLPETVVNPGIFAISKTLAGYILHATEFNNEVILEEYIQTKEIVDKIRKFFSKVDLYKELRPGETPKRGFLLYGSPGGGKSSTITKTCKELLEDSRTFVLIWHTDKFDPSEVKDFIQSFKYDGIDKMILVAEDIGGTEIDQVRMRSDSSLLSLLDNVEKTFTIPTVILATTNHPEVFLGNLTNRPQRFDQCIEVTPPPAELRGKFLEFFSKGRASEEDMTKIKHRNYDSFSIAHIKEVVIRSALEDVTLQEAMEQVRSEIERYNKAFSKQKSMGIGMS